VTIRLKRAGLDYWDFVAVRVYESWQVRAASEFPGRSKVRMDYSKKIDETKISDIGNLQGNQVLIIVRGTVL